MTRKISGHFQYGYFRKFIFHLWMIEPTLETPTDSLDMFYRSQGEIRAPDIVAFCPKTHLYQHQALDLQRTCWLMVTKIHSLCLNTRQDDGVTQGWYEKALTPMLKWMCVFPPEILMKRASCQSEGQRKSETVRFPHPVTKRCSKKSYLFFTANSVTQIAMVMTSKLGVWDT